MQGSLQILASCVQIVLPESAMSRRSNLFQRHSRPGLRTIEGIGNLQHISVPRGFKDPNMKACGRKGQYGVHIWLLGTTGLHLQLF